MSTYAGEREFGRSERDASRWQRGIDRLLASELHLSRELWLYVGLVLIAALLRYSDLGTRALHHDESLHTTYSWYLVTGKGYVHDPLMHGPLLFHITALVYLLFGASDATSRFAPALIGTALVFLPYFLRPWLGRTGAFATAVFLALSPSLLYYSRFIRHDPFVIFCTLGLVVCIFRHRLSQQPRWLYMAAALLMLSFASMEITYIIAAIALLYLNGSTASQLTDKIAAHVNASPGRRLAIFVALLPIAWLVVVAWPLLERERERFGLDELPADGPMLLVLGLLTAPQFSAAVRVPLNKLLHYDITTGQTINLLGHHVTRAQAVGVLTVLTLLVLTAVLGFWWNPRRWAICLVVFYVPYFLLFTTFLTNKQGWSSGIWGALSYWLDQQDVRRGTQPVFYYAMTISAYEYLTLALGAVGLVIHAARRGVDALTTLLFAVALIPLLALVNTNKGNTATIPVVVAAIGLATVAMRGDPLRQFVVFYFGCLFFGLSVAGEKMPWLTEHFALPLALLAGLTVRDVFELLFSLPLAQRNRAAALLLVGGLAAAFLAFALAARGAGDGLRLGAAALVIALLSGGGLVLWRLLHGAIANPAALALRAGGMIVAVAFVGFFGTLTARADRRLNWVHPDTPDEMLIYTQSSPDIPKVMKLIDQLARESGQGKALRITVDSNDAFTWPWAWYLRDYPGASFPDLSAYVSSPSSAAGLNPGAVLIANAQDVNVENQFAGQYGPGQRLHHRWWFPEGYKTTSANSFVQRLKNGSEFKRWWGYITNRDGYGVPSSDISPQRLPDQSGQPAIVPGSVIPGREYLGAVDSVVFFPADWTPGMGLRSTGGGAVQASARVNGATLTVGATGVLPGQLSRPAGVALDAAGNMYVADSLNNRVQKFDAAGAFVAEVGGPTSSVQFKEPWGIAVDGGGNVYVADTWHHRIVKLDANLKLVKAWGNAVGPAGPSSGLDLYGPRDLAVDAAGDLWVVDTGDARVVHYDANGTPLGAFGGHGAGPGQFEEPVGIAIAPDGTFFVADTWNNRIQIFDKTFSYQGEIRSDTWGWAFTAADRGVENKPYLAALADGSVLATFPNGHVLARFDRQGNVLFSADRLPGESAALRDPLGVAAAANGDVLLSDGALNQLTRLPAAALGAAR